MTKERGAELKKLRWVRGVKRKGSGDKRPMSWYFRPPKELVELGLTENRVYHDGRVAIAELPAEIARIESYLSGNLSGPLLKDPTLAQCIASYLHSTAFLSLSRSSQNSYESCLKIIAKTKISSTKTFGMVKVKSINGLMCSIVYDTWLKEETHYQANRNTVIFSALMSYLMSLDMVQSNPMARVKKKVYKVQRNVIWTRDQVKKVLDYCFSDFKYRSLGLLILMCYEWCQRPKDIRRLRWSNLDFDGKFAKVTQTKRGATVYLPMTEQMYEMLKQQHDDYSFQDLVIPVLLPDKKWGKLSSSKMSSQLNEVLEELGLPRELRVGDLRKTGIMELVEAGADSLQIMNLTGHKNVSSLSPYMKHSLNGSKKAMEIRNATT